MDVGIERVEFCCAELVFVLSSSMQISLRFLLISSLFDGHIPFSIKTHFSLSITINNVKDFRHCIVRYGRYTHGVTANQIYINHVFFQNLQILLRQFVLLQTITKSVVFIAVQPNQPQAILLVAGLDQ